MPIKVLSAARLGLVAGITQGIRWRPTTAPTSST
jgi:hypothetical protein